MARTVTSGDIVAQWDDGDNPGAGTKDLSITGGGTGLNANFKEISNVIKQEHNADGTHKTAVIDGTNLKSTVADGSTIQKNGSSKLEVISGSITATQLKTTGGSEAVTTATIRDNAVTTAKINDSAVTTAKINAAAVTLAKMGTNAVDATIITHDNNRTKANFQLVSSSESSGAYFTFQGITLSSSLGVSMTRAGSITSIRRRNASAEGGTEYSYGTKTFAKGDRIALRWQTSGGTPRNVILVKNGSDYISSGIGTGTDGDGAPPVIYNIEIEYDN